MVGQDPKVHTQLSLFVCAVADRSDYLIVITELQKLCAASNIDESTITVRGSSHIGGHQYAGRYILFICLCIYLLTTHHVEMMMMMVMMTIMTYLLY